jgi:mono/diheme cytochrome c family protein
MIGTMNQRIIFAIAVPAMAAGLLTAATRGQDRFPNGPGKAELLKVCSNCHEAETVLAYSQTAGEWATTLEAAKVDARKDRLVF